LGLLGLSLSVWPIIEEAWRHEILTFAKTGISSKLYYDACVLPLDYSGALMGGSIGNRMG